MREWDGRRRDGGGGLTGDVTNVNAEHGEEELDLRGEGGGGSHDERQVRWRLLCGLLEG